jgi:hypothetical protein
VLYQRDPEQGRGRSFSLMIEWDLFGTIRLVRNCGFAGLEGQPKAEILPNGTEAARALERWATAQRQKG